MTGMNVGGTLAPGGHNPLIVFLEMQNRSLPDLPGALDKCVKERLENCGAVLRMARLSGWPVAHVLRRAGEGEYDPGDDAWRPIEGFEPTFCEMTYITQKASAFSNPHFARMISVRSNRELVLAGVQSGAASLMTLVDARGRGLSITCIEDTDISDPIGCEDAGLAGLIVSGVKTEGFLRRFARNDLMLRLAGA